MLTLYHEFHWRFRVIHLNFTSATTSRQIQRQDGRFDPIGISAPSLGITFGGNELKTKHGNNLMNSHKSAKRAKFRDTLTVVPTPPPSSDFGITPSGISKLPKLDDICAGPKVAMIQLKKLEVTINNSIAG